MPLMPLMVAKAHFFKLSLCLTSMLKCHNCKNKEALIIFRVYNPWLLINTAIRHLYVHLRQSLDTLVKVSLEFWDLHHLSNLYFGSLSCLLSCPSPSLTMIVSNLPIYTSWERFCLVNYRLLHHFFPGYPGPTLNCLFSRSMAAIKKWRNSAHLRRVLYFYYFC